MHDPWPDNFVWPEVVDAQSEASVATSTHSRAAVLERANRLFTFQGVVGV
jgi:hypothetical protein